MMQVHVCMAKFPGGGGVWGYAPPPRKNSLSKTASGGFSDFILKMSGFGGVSS